MDQQAATAHGDRSPTLNGTETEGHAGESTGLTTLTWSSALGAHSLKDIALILP